VSPWDVLSAALLLSGASLSLLGALGMVRFPDVLARLHAAGKPQTPGVLLVLGGVAPQLGDGSQTAALVLVALFQIATAPVVAATIGRMAHRTGEFRGELLVVDELTEHRGRS